MRDLPGGPLRLSSEAASLTLSRSVPVPQGLKLKAGIHRPYLDIFDNDNYPLRSYLNDIQNATAHLVHEQILSHASVYSPFHSIRNASFTVLEREQAKAAAVGIPTPTFSGPPSNVAGRGGEKG